MNISDILLTVDFDRTLTAQDSTIPERNLEAIRYFMDQGGAFTVNTGRSLPMTRAFSEQVTVNAPLLLYNGSAAYDTQRQELVFAHRIQLDLWDTVEKAAARYPDMIVEVQSLDAHYNFRPDPMWKPFSDHNRCANRYVQVGEDLGPFLKFTVYGQLRDVTVANLYQASQAELAQFDRMEQELYEMYGDAITVFRAAPRILDIHARGVSKIRSARELQAQLGKKLLICVGDGDNDIPMLEGADYAFCPSDALVAHRFPNVCPCGQGAVADVIYEKIPEILGKMG